MKRTAEELLDMIKRLGQETLEEYRIRCRLDISHGQFCQLRKELVERGKLLVTHPRRKAVYTVLEG